jgi:hypothetical protein
VAFPVRLEDSLMRSATLAGARQQRSAAEQVEYWATLAREVVGVLDPVKLLDVLSGLAALEVVLVTATPVAAQQVFATLQQQRRSGRLSQAMSQAVLRYQGSAAHLGCLDEINADGSRRLGHFRDGVFMPQ